MSNGEELKKRGLQENLTVFILSYRTCFLKWMLTSDPAGSEHSWENERMARLNVLVFSDVGVKQIPSSSSLPWAIGDLSISQIPSSEQQISPPALFPLLLERTGNFFVLSAPGPLLPPLYTTFSIFVFPPYPHDSPVFLHRGKWQLWAVAPARKMDKLGARAKSDRDASKSNKAGLASPVSPSPIHTWQMLAMSLNAVLAGTQLLTWWELYENMNRLD